MAAKKAAIPSGPYCYALVDAGEVFYIGKGRGRRMFEHEGDARKGRPGAKCERIRAIWARGGAVECQVLSEHPTDEEALAEENRLLGLYSGLTNLAGPKRPHSVRSVLAAQFREIRQVAENVMPFVEWMRAKTRSPLEVRLYHSLIGNIRETETFLKARLEQVA